MDLLREGHSATASAVITVVFESEPGALQFDLQFIPHEAMDKLPQSIARDGETHLRRWNSPEWA